jgi:uncharacterized membrane protein
MRSYITALSEEVEVGPMVGSDEDRTMRTIVVLLVVVIVALPVVMLVAMGLTGWDSDGFGMMGSMGGGWGLMMAIPGAILLVIILIIVLVAISDKPGHQVQSNVPYPVQYYPPVPPFPGVSTDALSILDRRMASGEISIEEYNRMKSEMMKR